jgi:hypothetical protein
MLDERGMTLMEALTAVTISVIAVIGLAHSFGVGRAMVDRYEVARAALGVAQAQLETMATWPRADVQLALGYRSSATPFVYQGAIRGSSSWTVTPWDSPALPGTADLKRVVVTVRWQHGARGDSLSLERLWLP